MVLILVHSNLFKSNPTSHPRYSIDRLSSSYARNSNTLQSLQPPILHWTPTRLETPICLPNSNRNVVHHCSNNRTSSPPYSATSNAKIMWLNSTLLTCCVWGPSSTHKIATWHHHYNKVLTRVLALSLSLSFLSGFTRDDLWGYRSPEPQRCSISSLALVLLKTGITHETQGGVEMTGPPNLARMNPQVNSGQLTTAQKLLLFWRKPAVCVRCFKLFFRSLTRSRDPSLSSFSVNAGGMLPSLVWPYQINSLERLNCGQDEFGRWNLV
jgi:hypothetical protein